MTPTLWLSYACCYGDTFEHFLERAQSQGYSGVQIIPDQSPNLVEELGSTRVQEIAKLALDLGLGISVHNVFYDINLLSVVPEVRESSFRITEDVMVLGEKLGATNCVVHPGYMFPGWRSDDSQSSRFWEGAMTAMDRLDKLSADRGLPVLLENGSYYLTSRFSDKRTPLHVGIERSELERLLGERSNLGLCLDLNKAVVSGQDLQAIQDEFGPRVKQFQLSSLRRHSVEILNAIERAPAHLPVVLESSAEGLAALRSRF